MSKKELLQLLQKHTYCHIKRSKIHGVGVFAVKNIPKGINPFKHANKVAWHGLEKKDVSKLDTKIVRLLYDFFSVQGGTLWVPDSGLTGMDMSFYMNTSKKPNIKTVDNGEIFVSARLIKTGEELTVDYGTFSDPDDLV